MDGKTFGRSCARIDGLSVGQIKQLRVRLRGLDARIDRRGESLAGCLHCGAKGLVRRGQTRTGLRRLRCKSWRRTFSSATGTALARLRMPETSHGAVADMLGPAPNSCPALAEQLGVDEMTVWQWRMRLLAAHGATGVATIGGVVEADEKLFRESRRARGGGSSIAEGPRWCPHPTGWSGRMTGAARTATRAVGRSPS